MLTEPDYSVLLNELSRGFLTGLVICLFSYCDSRLRRLSRDCGGSNLTGTVESFTPRPLSSASIRMCLEMVVSGSVTSPDTERR